MKKKIVLLLVLIILLLGAGVAYAYFATDMFKSEKELFFSYLLSDDLVENLQDEKLTEYLEKKNNTPYTNDGKITLNLSGDIAEDESAEMLKQTKVTFEGNIDNSNKMIEQLITVDASQGFNIPIKFKTDGEVYGIQSDLLHDKYIAIRNDDLKKLAEKFDIPSEDIPNKIESTNLNFTDEEIKILQERYIKIFYDNLTDDMFTKTKDNGQTKINLSIPADEFLALMEQVLSTVKNDEILLSKISDETLVKEIQDEIDNLIEKCQKIETTEADKFNVVLSIEGKKLVECEINIDSENEKITLLTLENVDNKLIVKIYDQNGLIMELNIEKEQNENNVSQKISMMLNSEEKGKVDIDIRMQYNNISELDNVEENMIIDMSYEEGSSIYSEKSGIDINLTNLVTFEPDIKIESFNTDNAIILNDATQNEIENLIISIYENLGLM